MSTETPAFEMTIEVILLPVSDLERAKDFYANKLGFHLDYDSEFNDMRFIQLTPRGSGCSIVMGTGIKGLSEMTPGSIKGTHLVVKNIGQVREAFIKNGVDVSDIEDMGGGVKYAYFSDPDGNFWALQELGSRATA